MSLFMMVRQSKVGEQALNAAPSTSAQAVAASRARPRGRRDEASGAPAGRL
uniref:hypothetical protein n=1 Tax=Paraburkholderia sp. SG-MS1 TaxID=2023741 RepID=UPI001448656A|nr:hypothetical protein [Paraburkholderia sp. SG-MS1]